MLPESRPLKKMSIPWARPFLRGREKEYLMKALDSTWISDGHYIRSFEKEFNGLLGTKYGLTTSSGTTALELAMLALGIGPGDEVIVPGYTFAAAVNAVLKAGAVPVYADVDPATWCIDPASAGARVSKKTRAIVPVHTYGNVCAMEALRSLARKRGLFLIEDAAEAAFSRYGEKYAGTMSTIGCFSFQATKTITMGEGGFAVAHEKRLFDKMTLLRNHGMKGARRYWHYAVGFNFRLTNLQAAVGCGQLENRGRIIDEKRRIHARYSRELSGVPGLALQQIGDKVTPVIWTVAVKVDPRRAGMGRERLRAALSAHGIETRPGFYPFSAMPVYSAPRLPVSDALGKNIVCLPSFCGLADRDIALICRRIRNILGYLR